MLLVDGLIRGVWSPQKGRDGVTIEVEPFEEVPASVRRAAEEHAQRYEALLGEPVTVRWAQ